MNVTEDRNAGAPSSDAGERPRCFGDPERVCPTDEEGIMQPQPDCISCTSLRSCLQAALRRKGLLAPSVLESKPVTKVRGFLKRWSDQKLAHGGAKSTDSGK